MFDMTSKYRESFVKGLRSNHSRDSLMRLDGRSAQRRDTPNAPSNYHPIIFLQIS